MNHATTFILGTRGSPLALWQAKRVQSMLQQVRPDAAIHIEIIHTTGDKILDKPLVQIGDKGLFTKEIEKALLDQTIDFAVHSFKDLPTMLPDGLSIGSIPERDSPFDALVSKEATTLRDLPPHPTVATGSLRRRAQIAAARPDATLVDVRGNVNTRLRKLDESDWDALIMAEAGLRRMQWEDRISGVLSIEEMLPAPAQGALAIESRVDDTRVTDLLASIHNPSVALSVQAERGFLAELEGGCQVPIASHAVVHQDVLTLHGFIASLDGSQTVRDQGTWKIKPGFIAEEVGRQLAQTVLQKGGKEIVESLTI